MIVWLGFLLCVVREVVRETVFDVYSIYYGINLIMLEYSYVVI